MGVELCFPEITSLLKRFYQKWTIFWPRPGQSKPDPDNKAQTKRARWSIWKPRQTCRNHSACAEKRPQGGQTQGRQIRPRARQKQSGSKQDVHKTPRLCTKTGRKLPQQKQTMNIWTPARNGPTLTHHCACAQKQAHNKSKHEHLGGEDEDNKRKRGGKDEKRR